MADLLHCCHILKTPIFHLACVTPWYLTTSLFFKVLTYNPPILNITINSSSSSFFPYSCSSPHPWYSTYYWYYCSSFSFLFFTSFSLSLFSFNFLLLSSIFFCPSSMLSYFSPNVLYLSIYSFIFIFFQFSIFSSNNQFPSLITSFISVLPHL